MDAVAQANHKAYTQLTNGCKQFEKRSWKCHNFIKPSISEEFSITLDVLKQSIVVASVLQHVKEKYSTQLQA